MNKKAYYIMLVALSLLIVTSVVYIGCHFIVNDITTRRLNNHEYQWNRVQGSGCSVVIEENMSKLNLFNTSIIVEVYLDIDEKNSELLAKFDTTINTPREKFSEKNYQVESNDEYITLELYDKNENLEQKHRFYYEDLVEDKGRTE